MQANLTSVYKIRDKHVSLDQFLSAQARMQGGFGGFERTPPLHQEGPLK